MAAALPRGISAVTRSRAGRQLTLYQVRVTWQGRRELVGRFETMQDAKVALRLAQADILRGTFVPPRVTRAEKLAEVKAEQAERMQAAYTVRDLSEDWLDYVRRMGRKQSTIYTYERKLEASVLPELGEFPVEAVTPQVVQDWYDALDAKHGNGVSRGAYMALAGMFNYATGTAKGLPHDFVPLVASSPCRVVGATKHRPVRPAEAEDVVLEDDQLAALVNAMPEQARLAVLLGGWMALRIGEVLGLQRRDFTTHDERTWLNVSRQLQSRGQGLRLDTPKTAAGRRSLPVLTRLEDALTDHLEHFVAEAGDAPLFPRKARGDLELHPNTLRKWFDAAIKTANKSEAKIPETFVFHGLRHTALTRLGRAGATTEELKLWAGQRDAETVARYQHATRKRLLSLADRTES